VGLQIYSRVSPSAYNDAKNETSGHDTRVGRREMKERTHLNGEDSRPLLGNTLGTTGTGSLVGSTTSLHLVGENLGTVLLGLGLVDVVHKNTLKVVENENQY